MTVTAEGDVARGSYGSRPWRVASWPGRSFPTNPVIGLFCEALEAAGELTYADKGNPTQEELAATIGKLIELKKAGHFRALWNTFDESVNLMAAGEVVREVSGTSWEDFVARRIFAPLTMSSSSTSIAALASQPNVASPGPV